MRAKDRERKCWRGISWYLPVVNVVERLPICGRLHGEESPPCAVGSKEAEKPPRGDYPIRGCLIEGSPLACYPITGYPIADYLTGGYLTGGQPPDYPT